MAYRRTENMARRLAAREEAIVAAATALAAAGGLAAIHVAAVAEHVNIATGTVYRYFPAKADLVGEVVVGVAQREIEAMRKAANAAPGPLSALAASIVTFAARTLTERRLAWGILGEAVDADIESARLAFRGLIAAEIAGGIRAAAAGTHFPDIDAAMAAAAIVGILTECLLGPLASPVLDNAGRREIVQTATLLALRAVGVVDARARGLIAQCPIP